MHRLVTLCVQNNEVQVSLVTSLPLLGSDTRSCIGGGGLKVASHQQLDYDRYITLIDASRHSGWLRTTP